jgi:hypothetical protein
MRRNSDSSVPKKASDAIFLAGFHHMLNTGRTRRSFGLLSRNRARQILPAIVVPCTVLAACSSMPASVQSLLPSSGQSGLFAAQTQPITAGMTAIQERLDGFVEATIGAGTNAARRVTGRPVEARDACMTDGQADDCASAAKIACKRSSFGDGAPLSSSTYQACSGGWGMQPWAAPDGVCKTKRRLQTALCW